MGNKMKKVSLIAILSSVVALPALGASVSRIDVSGNQRMDAESIRILSDVKIGDNVGGYVIEGITQNQVQITYKNNTYVASVGELFTRGSLESNQAVVNLENKFAGRNRNK